MTNLQTNNLTNSTQDSAILDVNIEQFIPLITPKKLREDVPISEKARQTVLTGRQTIQNILDGTDKRLLIVVGPCSIHDPKSALEYVAPPQVGKGLSMTQIWMIALILKKVCTPLVSCY